MTFKDDETVKETVYSLVCVCVALVGVGLLLHAWSDSGGHRLWTGGIGALLALAGSWHSGVLHDADDPKHPHRRFRRFLR